MESKEIEMCRLFNLVLNISSEVDGINEMNAINEKREAIVN